MGKKYLIMSDIHGNVSAFKSVLMDCCNEQFDGVILLGDCIDYGMRSNEVIQMIKSLKEDIWDGKIVSNIFGNHEKLVIDKDLERLSSDRGRVIARYTADHLSDESVEYIQSDMQKEGICEFFAEGKRCLAVHGSLDDYYWKSISPDHLNGDYSKYDIVFSGHSHYSHFFTYFYKSENAELRNKKAVYFINPGSVGQPRNQNPCAQYAVVNFPEMTVELRAVEYDIKYEQSLFPQEIDDFYKERLKLGV